MKAEGGMGPVDGSPSGRPGVCEKPRQFQERWMEHMAPLPSQVLIPLREALKIHRKRAARLRSLDAARYALRVFKVNTGVYRESVDAKLDRLGVEQVDPLNPLEADAFLARLGDSGRKALDKCDRVQGAIAYAEMTIQWLVWELSHG